MRSWNWKIAMAAVSVALLSASTPAVAQPLRVLGVDISYWNCGSSGGPGISQANWNTGYSPVGGNRQFSQIRATRGGTTGVDQTAGYPSGGTLQTLSHRYDDPRFFQNMKRALAAGMQVGPYHRGQEVSTNTGTDEADHMIQTAGPWMRPGYTVPMLDWEDGTFGNALAQWAIDFSDEIFAVMQIRPCVYIGGANSQTVQSCTPPIPAELAQPATLMPSVIAPRFYMLWNPRYATSYDLQTSNPKDSYGGFYGPWDDYGNLQPWSFWQYNSAQNIPGFNATDTSVDGDVCHGDIEYMRNYLVPAVWWNDSSGDWGTLANWNSGQTPTTPPWPSDQPPLYESATLPTPRLPGASGSGPDSGQYDTVILERPNANITVTLSIGTYNIRKLYMRETLNITGGSLTVNYDPTYRADNSATVVHAGPVSAQFSGPVTLSGSSSLSLHTLQVDAAQAFTLNGGTLTFNTINLMPDSTTPAKILMSGDVNFNPLSNATATIANGSGSGSSGLVDLGSGTRTFNVGNGTSAVDLSVGVPISNGALAKAGLGTVLLNSANTYSGGTTISAGTLEGGVSSSIPGNLTNSAGTLKLDNATAMASGATLALASSPGAGAVNLNFSGTQTVNALYFGPTRKAAGTWAASGATHNNAAFSGSGILNVTSGPASIIAVSRTSGSSPSTYGNSLTFTATVTGNSPGGTVQFKVDGLAWGSPVTLAGGSAPLVVSTLSVSGSPHQITAYYSGDDNNGLSDSSASPMAQAITAKPLTVGLTGTATKTYNGTTAVALAAGNYSLPGVVSGDTVNLNNPVSGTYDTRNVGSGKTVSVTGLAISGPSAGNYTLSSTSASGAIGTITPLTTSCSVVSSVNPSGPGTNVTFTAAVNGVPPAADLPTGNVVFSANGTPFATNALVSGSTSASTASLPVGTNAMTAEYAGGGNFLASTGSVAQVVKPFVTCSQTNALLSMVDNRDGTFTLTFVGTPQAQYYVLASPDVAAPMTSWAPVAGSTTNTVTNASGWWQFRVTNTVPQQFYRSTAVVPCP